MPCPSYGRPGSSTKLGCRCRQVRHPARDGCGVNKAVAWSLASCAKSGGVEAAHMLYMCVPVY